MPAIWIPKRLVEVGLINTAAQSAANFACHCELEYESRVHAAAKEILFRKAKVVMITGPSASGKTTTAHKIADSLARRGHNAKVISLDDFFINLNEYPNLPNGEKDYESITALDIPEINRCLNSLINTGKAQLPQFDFITGKRKPDMREIEMVDGVLIVEGIHALNPQLIELVPQDVVYKIYAGLREEYSDGGMRFLPTRDIRLARRMVRDFKFRGHSLEKTMGMWSKVCCGEDKFIKVFKPNADLLFDTSFSYEICCLAPFVKELKSGLEPDSKYKNQLDILIKKFEICEGINDGYIPQASMLREFIGN